MARKSDTPRKMSTLERITCTLEKYKVLIDLLGAITAVVALLALYYSGVSAYSANQSLELARKGHDLQAAQLQPVFQVFFKRETKTPGAYGWPVYSDVRAVSPSGTFLDAWAELHEFLVVGYYPGGPGQAAFWYPPYSTAAIIPTRVFAYSSTVVSDTRGTLIQAWHGESNDVTKRALVDWARKDEQQRVDFNKILPSVDFVAIVKISYLDILRQEHSLYFKVGGLELSLGTLRTLRAVGRAPILDPNDGQRCFDIYSDDARENWTSDATSINLRSRYDRFMKGPNKDLGKVCG